MSSHPFTVEPLPATFGARITDIEIAQLDSAGFDALYKAWLEYGLLVFPGQHLSKEEQVAFARRFGELEIEIVPISNVDSNGAIKPHDDDSVKILKGNMGWHFDSTYMPVQAMGAVFSAHVVPKKDGQTGWADMRAGYDALDDTTKAKIENLSAYHSLYYSQAKLGFAANKRDDFSSYGFDDQDPPLRPLVKIHPKTGRRVLLLGRHAHAIPGMSAAESEDFIRELSEFTCQAPRVYHHDWTPGDVVLWDNRCLMHQARPWDLNEPRVMFHSRIAGEQSSEFAPSS